MSAMATSLRQLASKTAHIELLRVCKINIVLDQLDELAKVYSQQPSGNGESLRLIAQIKKDVAKIPF